MSYEPTPPPPAPEDPATLSGPESLPEELIQVVRFRSLPLAVIGGLILVMAFVTVYVTRDGWHYYLKPDEPVSLGRAKDATLRGRLSHDTYVKLSFRPLLDTEARQRRGDTRPGCLTGPSRTFYFVVAAETGDHLVVQTRKSLRAAQALPKRVTVSGRLLRFDALPDTFRAVRHFIYDLADCRTHPESCNRNLLITADLAPGRILPMLGTPGGAVRSQEGYRIELRRTTPLFLMFRYPDEWEYRVSNATRADATARVLRLGVPWAYVESRGADQYFILRAPRRKALAWIRAQRKGSGYSISERTASHLTTFGWIHQRGDQLVVTHVRQGFPPDYQLVPARPAPRRAATPAFSPATPKPAPRRRAAPRRAAPRHAARSKPARYAPAKSAPGGSNAGAAPDNTPVTTTARPRPATPAVVGPTLRAVEHEGIVRVPLSRLSKVTYSGPRQLPPDTFLLMEGRAPHDAWPAALVASLALLFALAGLVMLLLGLRRPRRPSR